MHKHLKILLVTSMLAGGLAAAPAIYAHGSDSAGGSMMGRGMMGQGDMMDMMDQMSGGMMKNCSQMMGDGHQPARPNEQWRDRSPQQPDQPR